MANKTNILITGASGCIGSYITSRLQLKPDVHLHLFVRDPKKIKFSLTSDMTVYSTDMEQVGDHHQLIQKMDYIIHVATCWDDGGKEFLVNVDKTAELFETADPIHCQRIIYFSTASILGAENQPIPEAGTLGTGYVRSKYKAYINLKSLKNYSKIVTLFPTVVFGGNATHPESHVSSGIIPNLSKLKVIKYLYFDAACHYLHAKDIAAVVEGALFHPTPKKEYVLGRPSVTVKEIIFKLCTSFSISVLIQIKVPCQVIKFLAKALHIKMSSWDRYCIENPHFIYTVTDPESFGFEICFPDLDSIFKDIAVQKNQI